MFELDESRARELALDLAEGRPRIVQLHSNLVGLADRFWVEYLNAEGDGRPWPAAVEIA